MHTLRGFSPKAGTSASPAKTFKPFGARHLAACRRYARQHGVRIRRKPLLRPEDFCWEYGWSAARRCPTSFQTAKGALVNGVWSHQGWIEHILRSGARR